MGVEQGLLALIGAADVGAYEIEQSLRFNQYVTHLARTPSSAGNVKKWTWSGWVKRGKGGIAGQGGDYHPASIVAYDGSTYNLPVYFGYNTEADQALFYYGNTPLQSKTTQVFRDFSGWYHFVAHLDTDQATAANRQKLYVNGVEVTAWATQNLPSQGDSAGKINTTSTHRIGWTGVTGQQYFDGYMAECHFVDGQALDPTDFGEFDKSGVWRPKRYTGTYGTNGFYLKFDPTATNGIGHDHSGNGNNFTATGFTTSGTGTDVMSDTPTTNWATLNPLDKHGSLTLTNGNLDVETSSGYYDVASTFHVESGKYYWEATQTSVSGANEGLFGITRSNNNCQSHSSVDSFRIVYEGNAGAVYVNGTGLSNVTGLATYGVGDTVGAALSIEDGTISFYKNGTLQTTITSASVVGGNVWKPYVGMYQAGWTVNFGQRAFAYTPPTNFLPLNTSNLPAPTVKDGSKNFNTVIYTGASPSDRAVTGVGFQPDFTWIKARTQAYSHALYDAVRGATKELHSDTTDQEDTDTNGLKSFDSDGFTVGSDGEVGDPTGTRVSWNWKANGSGSSNTDGSIPSTVSANPTAGFSIVSFNSGASGAKTVGHGLGVALQLIITKDRDNATNWTTYHASATTATDKYLNLNGTAAVQTASGIWGSTLPTSTVFGFGSGTASAPNADCIAYCFAEVEGYSKFGSYTGNNSSDGPFVYCGFKPRWIMRKATGDTSNWVILDTARDTYNETDNQLLPNTSGAESDGSDIDILSNGFKMRSSALNGSTTYIFAAFAENPFGGFGVSPATAR